MKQSIVLVSPIMPPDIGGPASYVWSLAALLAKSHEVEVVGFCSGKPIKSDFKVRVVGLGGGVVVRQLKLLMNLWQASHQANLIYAQGTLTVGIASLVASRLRGVPLILKFVGDEIWEGRRNQGANDTLEAFYQKHHIGVGLWLHRLCMRQANLIITPSVYLKRFLVKCHQVKADKIQVVANPVEVKRDPDVTPDAGQLIFVGRLVPWKHIDQLLEGQSKLEKKWHLIIVGDGPERGRLEQQVVRLGLNQRVQFHGSKPKAEVYKLIQSSQFLVLPSDYEGQSHVLIEASLLGTRAITRDIPANRELLGDYGVYVRDFDGKSLYAALQKAATLTLPVRDIQKTHSWHHHLKKLESYWSKLGLT